MRKLFELTSRNTGEHTKKGWRKSSPMEKSLQSKIKLTNYILIYKETSWKSLHS